jgi:hypothetical protein
MNHRAALSGAGERAICPVTAPFRWLTREGLAGSTPARVAVETIRRTTRH